jgi:hypothetical protein
MCRVIWYSFSNWATSSALGKSLFGHLMTTAPPSEIRVAR